LLVCHCHRVCDRTVRLCVRSGDRSTDDVGRSCGAGTACGGCKPAIEAIVRGLCGLDDAQPDEDGAAGAPLVRIASSG
jgi:NAD(P)H-nitrite reductase large subunit